MAAFGVFATTAVTSVTAQNTVAVTGVCPVAATFVDLQISAILDDFAVASVKTGMLGSVEVVELVADRAAAGELPNLVVDPVMVSSSGHQLLDPGGSDAYRRRLLPQALVVTPNLAEASLLSGIDLDRLTSVEGMIEAAATIHTFGARWVLVKGGHLPRGAEGPRPDFGHPAEDPTGPAVVPDILYGDDGPIVITGSWVNTRNTHGTGCSLSAAIAARLACGAAVPAAVNDGIRFVRRGLSESVSWRLGGGHGPLDHLGWLSPGATTAGS